MPCQYLAILRLRKVSEFQTAVSLIMFARPRAKAKLAPPSKKRKREAAIEEITFDHSAREDYLTGFHKRKLQRIKHAKEDAAKREREDKLTVRKKVYESLPMPE